MNDFIVLVQDVWNSGFLGIGLGSIISSLLVLLAAFLFRGFVISVILNSLGKLAESTESKIDDEILNAMSDDLNTPKAISVLNSLAKEYPLLAGSQRISCINKIKSSGQLLGILHQDPKAWFSKDTSHMDVVLIEKLI